MDALPPSHPHALANRKDLDRINRFLGTHRWFGGTLSALIGTSDRILELGAGQGLLSDFLRRRNDFDSLCEWHALDIQPVPSRVTEGLQWHHADLVRFGEYHTFEVVFGNFILHQFDEKNLKSLGDHLQHGAPGYMPSDNGPEFIAKIIQQWLRENNIKALYIDPGKSLEEWIRRELQRPL